MATRFKVVLSIAVLGLCVASAAGQTDAAAKLPALVQTAHIVGDTNDGFRKTCLIIYSDGSFHRERRHQVKYRGRPQFDWESPEVFEGQLDKSEANALRAIVNAPGFSSVAGAVGDVRGLPSKLVFGPQGVILPHDNIEIITVSVTRPNAPQVFEIAESRVARRQEPLRAFLEWVNGAEHSQAVRLAASSANNCSSDVATAGSAAIAHMATGIDFPTATYAPGPQPPHNTQAVKVELLINPDGSVAQASLEAQASPDVTQSVLDAVRKWKFQPARLLGVPIAMPIHLRIQF